MKDIGRTIIRMDKVNIYLEMVIFMMVTLLMGLNKDLVNLVG